MAAQGRAHLGSFVCTAGHELRVTARCLVEDLDAVANASFDALAERHGIVRALLRERHAVTAGADTLGAARRPRPLTILRHTHHWRGATWHDADDAVVWLCACRRHRSGECDDAFPYFEDLRDRGLIWPTNEDYEALLADRGERFAAFVVADAPGLLERARAELEIEHMAMIGLQPVAVVVRVVETLEETFIAIAGVNLQLPTLQLLLVALYPERPFTDWRQEPRLPTRELDHTRAELCLSIVH